MSYIAQNLLNSTSVTGNIVGTAIDTSRMASITIQSSGTNSTTSALTFTDSKVNDVTDVVTITGHGYVTGIKGQLTSSGSLPGGLSLLTDYYIIRTDNDNLQFASTLTLASAGTAIDMTSVGLGTQTFTPTVQSAMVCASGDIDADSNNWAITGHGMITGVPVRLTTSGALPSPLALSTDYWAIRIDDNNLKLASTDALAVAGTPITLTGIGSGTQTITPSGQTAAAHLSGAINDAANTLTSTAHLLTTGMPVQLTTSSSLPTPLALATDYWLIASDADTLKIASSLTNANAGTAIDITYNGVGNQTVTPNAAGAVASAHVSGAVDSEAGSFTSATHGMKIGTKAILTTSGTAPTGLTAGSSYFIGVPDANTIKLCTTLANAVAGTGIALTSNGTGNQIITPTTYTAVTLLSGAIDTDSDSFTSVAHGLLDGAPVTVVSTGSYPSGLAASTTYYVIKSSADVFKLASTFANAAAGTAIDLLTLGSGDITIEPTNPYSAHSFAQATAINLAGNTIAYASHGYITGTVGQFTTTDTLPGGISASTNYWVIKSSVDLFQIASTAANADSATAIDITSLGAGTLTFTPTTFSNIQNLPGVINTEDDSFYSPAHGLVTGVIGRFTTTDTLPTGIVSAITDYYVIKVDADNFKVASSQANASTGTVNNITFPGAGTQTFTPTAYVAKTIASGFIDTYNNTFRKAAHGFITGLLTQLTTSSARPTGTSLLTDYYVIKIDADNFKIATSLVNAAAGTAVDMTSTGTGTQTITPVAAVAVVIASGAVSIYNNSFYKASHGFVTGIKGQITTSGSRPTGTALTTDYFVYRIDANNYALFDTQAHASAAVSSIDGTANVIDLTTQGVGTQTFTPTAYAAKTAASGAVDSYNNAFIKASHGLYTGDRIALTTGTTLPTGSAATNYWVTAFDANTVYLSTTLANVITGTYLDITDAGVGNQTLTPLVVAAKTFTSNTIDLYTNAFYSAAHALTTGTVGQFSTSSALPTGLLILTDYYVIVVDANYFKVASSLANALLGTAIDLTAVGTGTQTFTPTTLAGTITFEGSLDGGTTWTTTGQTKSFTITGSGINTITAFYPLIRANYVHTSGSLSSLTSIAAGQDSRE